ncbi:MAG: tail fiber protein [Flavipsychrobacter sp.]
MSSGMPTIAVMQGYLGEVRMFAGQKAPENWAFCEGQLLPIADNESLFALLGAAFGGNGTSTFALPDTRGKIMMGMFQGIGLSNRTLGEVGGQEMVSLTEAQMPKHKHAASEDRYMASSASYTPPAYNGDVGDTNSPVDAVFALEEDGNSVYNTTLVGPSSYMASWDETIDINPKVATTGSSQGHPNIMPVVAVNYIICTSGDYPHQA